MLNFLSLFIFIINFCLLNFLANIPQYHHLSIPPTLLFLKNTSNDLKGKENHPHKHRFSLQIPHPTFRRRNIRIFIICSGVLLLELTKTLTEKRRGKRKRRKNVEKINTRAQSRRASERYSIFSRFLTFSSATRNTPSVIAINRFPCEKNIWWKGRTWDLWQMILHVYRVLKKRWYI